MLFYAAVEELGAQFDESRLVRNLKCTWVKQAEIIKEPYLRSFLRNLLLYFPGDGLLMLGFVVELPFVCICLLGYFENVELLTIFVGNKFTQ